MNKNSEELQIALSVFRAGVDNVFENLFNRPSYIALSPLDQKVVLDNELKDLAVRLGFYFFSQHLAGIQQDAPEFDKIFKENM